MGGRRATLALVIGTIALAACTSIAPTPSGPSVPTQTTPAQTTGASPTEARPTASLRTESASLPIATDASPPTVPAAGVTLGPDLVLGIRYSGTAGLLFQGSLTALFEDGSVVPRDASGTIPEGGGPITQPLGEEIVAVRVTGTIQSSEGTYHLEIVGGHLEGLTFVPDQVLAVDEAAGHGETVQVDYGNVDR